MKEPSISVRWAFQWANKKWLEKRGLPSFINQSSVFAKPLRTSNYDGKIICSPSWSKYIC